MEKEIIFNILIKFNKELFKEKTEIPQFDKGIYDFSNYITKIALNYKESELHDLICLEYDKICEKDPSFGLCTPVGYTQGWDYANRIFQKYYELRKFKENNDQDKH